MLRLSSKTPLKMHSFLKLRHFKEPRFVNAKQKIGISNSFYFLKKKSPFFFSPASIIYSNLQCQQLSQRVVRVSQTPAMRSTHITVCRCLMKVIKPQLAATRVPLDFIRVTFFANHLLSVFIRSMAC